jgi:hypothetical protein
LEDLLAAHHKRPRSRVHSSHLFNRSTDNSVNPVCVVGEPLRVQCSLYNPLSSQLELQQLSLWCTHSGQDAPALNLLHDDPASLPFETKVIPELSLPGNQNVLVEFSVVPLREGPLVIKGIELNLGVGVRGSREFKVRGKRLNSTMKERTGNVYSKDLRLELVVTPPMPQLAVKVTLDSSRAVAGQLVPGVMELMNTSNTGMVNLSVACSRPDAVVFTDPTDTAAPSTFTPVFTPASPVSMLLHGAGSQLAANASAQVPIWVYATAPGTLAIHFIFYFEAVSTVQKMPYRFFRHSISLQTLPALGIVPRLFPAPHTLDEYIVSLRVENRHTSCPLRVDGVSCFHNAWKVETLPSIAPQDVTSAWLLPQGATTLHLLISRNTKEPLSHTACTTAALHTQLEKLPYSQFYGRAAGAVSQEQRAVCLMIDWVSAASPTILENEPLLRGMAYVPLRVGDDRLASADTSVVLRHASQRQHDFSNNPFVFSFVNNIFFFFFFFGL